MSEIKWWCGGCKKVQPGKLRVVTEPLQPGVDRGGANPKCPDCGTKMMPRVEK